MSVVINPFAGGRRARALDPGRIAELASRVATESGAEVRTVLTDCPDHACGRAREALDGGADVVVAWGGDGTVNEVASVLVGTTVALGIVPAGSGNGLGRELCLPRLPADALRVALAGRTQQIDVGRLNDRIFVNVAGFGLDAHVAACFNRAGHGRGLRHYVQVTIRELLSYRSRRYRVCAPGGVVEGAALLLAFANSRQYGNGASIAPNAIVDDGWLDMVMVAPTTRVADLWRARRLFTRTILGDPGVRARRVREATVEGERLMECHVDGEPFTVSGAARIEVRPGALRVCVP